MCYAQYVPLVLLILRRTSIKMDGRNILCYLQKYTIITVFRSFT